MSPYEQQVRGAIQATVFHSSTTYSWFGKMSPQLPTRIKRALTLKTARNYLLYNLHSQLYSDFYLQGSAAARRWETGGSTSERTRFVAALSAANMGSGYWESGWEVRAATEGEMVVHKGGLELWVRPEDCAITGDGPMTTGMPVNLRCPKEFLSMSPGFYMAQSDQELICDNSQSLVRLYWNLTPEGAVPLVRQATSILNRAYLPFRLKVLHDPNCFTRCDAAVVYVLKADYTATADILGHIYSEVAPYLKASTPAFTKNLAPGLGFAEDPGQDESFGQQRCRLLADGMIRAYERGARSLDERLHVVVDRFAEDGIRMDKPYLNSGSSDNATFQVAR